MPIEPMTIFSRIADPAKVARHLRGSTKKLSLDGADHNWRRAVMSSKSGTLTLTHDQDFYAGPNWEMQMAGMENYFKSFPKSKRQSSGILLPSTFTFALGVLVDPPCEDKSDERLQLVWNVAELLDGIVFTPSAVLDARGRTLFSMTGDEDADAVWPKVIATIHMPPKPPTASSDGASHMDASAAPSAVRVARRALAMTALTARAMLEQGEPLKPQSKVRTWVRAFFGGGDSERGDLLKWIDSIGVRDEFEPAEWDILQRPVGKLEQSQQIAATWRLEGLVVLAWALRRFDLPPHDRLVRWHPLWTSLGLNDAAAARLLLESPSLLPRHELAAAQSRLFSLHWRLRHFWLHPDPIDLLELSRTNDFGFDASVLPLIDDDLAIGGKRIDRAPEDVFQTAHSISLERHHAINWLLDGPEFYSQASEDT